MGPSTTTWSAGLDTYLAANPAPGGWGDIHRRYRRPPLAQRCQAPRLPIATWLNLFLLKKNVPGQGDRFFEGLAVAWVLQTGSIRPRVVPLRADGGAGRQARGCMVP